jgi:site-specific DNA-cytosine methylase
MSLSYAAIVPLIGGLPLGLEKSFGNRPDYLLSFTPFMSNDSHLVNYYKDVPYILLDQGGKHPHYVDVVCATPPCAGLSSLSPSANSCSATNDWMMITAKYVLEEMKPLAMISENAPRFSGEMGKPIVAKLMNIAKANGYTMSIYRTKSKLHGLSQVRERSFYFFWKGRQVPMFQYFDRPHKKIEDTIRSVSKNATQQIVTNAKIPSKDDPFYRYVLEEMEGGITHQQFFNKITKTVDVMHYIETNGHSYRDVKKFMLKEGYEKIAAKLDGIQDKLDAGGNIMRRMSLIGKDYIGAFVGHLPFSLTHPDEDRYITVREAMTIMGLPEDFELLHPKKNLNHVCQNVPVTTATDMAMEIKAVLEGRRDMMNGELIYQFNNNKSFEIIDTGPPSSLDQFF